MKIKTYILIALILLSVIYFALLKNRNQSNFDQLNETYNFEQLNYSKEISLSNIHNGIYEIGIIDSLGKIPLNYQFDGILEIEFTQNNKIIYKSLTAESIVKIYAENNKYYKMLCLDRFRLTNIKRDDSCKIKITVFKKANNVQIKNYQIYFSSATTP